MLGGTRLAVRPQQCEAPGDAVRASNELMFTHDLASLQDGASVLPRSGGRPPKLAPLAPMGIEVGDDPPSPVPKTLHGGARDWFAFLHGGAQAA